MESVEKEFSLLSEFDVTLHVISTIKSIIEFFEWVNWIEFRNFNLFLRVTKVNDIISLTPTNWSLTKFNSAYSRPCVCRIAWYSSFGVINSCPAGCIVMLDKPDVNFRNSLEYPLSSANGAFTLITWWNDWEIQKLRKLIFTTKSGRCFVYFIFPTCRNVQYFRPSASQITQYFARSSRRCDNLNGHERFQESTAGFCHQL